MATPLTVLGEYELSGGELDGARLDAELSFPAQIKTVLTNMRTNTPSTINDKNVDVLQGNFGRNRIITMYFDRATGYLVRTVRMGGSPIGRVPTQVDYDDYRDVPGLGIKMP